jgi:hypothetical protein
MGHESGFRLERVMSHQKLGEGLQVHRVVSTNQQPLDHRVEIPARCFQEWAS